MTHCIICGKRLWFEEWRNINKYAWKQEIDTQSWKGNKKYTYEFEHNSITYYPSYHKSRYQDAWYHIRCMEEKGTLSDMAKWK